MRPEPAQLCPRSRFSKAQQVGLAPGPAADTAQIVDPKAEDTGEDHLRLGMWREIGSEAAYYNPSDGWKWQEPMQPLEQPWALATS